MNPRKNGRGLRFPCECVSVHSGYSDPWAALAQKRLLNDGTKERVLNSVARQPKTIARLAKALGLSQPAIHGHVSDMVKSELLRESVAFEKKHPAENYYEPNFPVIKAEDRMAFDKACREMAEQMAEIFAAKRPELERTLQATTLTSQGWKFSDVAHFFYTCAYRGARELLEQRGVVPPCERHRDGAEWVFWAEESDTRATR